MRLGLSVSGVLRFRLTLRGCTSQSGVLYGERRREFYGDKLVDVLPALGTHKPMTDTEIATSDYGDDYRVGCFGCTTGGTIS